MKNDARNRVTNRPVAVSLHCYLLVCFGAQTLMPLAAFADTGLPPPAVHQTTQNSFPSSQALQRQGYDPSRGVLRVKDTNQGRPTVTSNGGTITGTQNKNVTVTGKYGEKATIQTATTQKVGSSALSKGIAAAYVLDSANNPDTRAYAQKVGSSIKQGDYLGAAHNAVLTAGSVLDSMFGGKIGDAARGLGEGLGKLPNDGNNDAALKRIFDKAKQGQDAAEKRGDFAGATANAAVAKAAETAANAAAASQGATTSGAKLAEASRNKDGSYSQLYLRRIDLRSGSNINPDPDINGIAYQIDKTNNIINWSPLENAKWLKVSLSIPPGYKFPSVSGTYYTPIRSDKELEDALKKVSGQSQQKAEKTAQEMQLTGSEVEAILKRMLESQQTNHQELMNQLAKVADAVQNATTSQEWTAKTATTEPYTPAGSDTPQQTQFSIDKNGNITATTIPRPDLKPNSSQAPMRTEVIKNPNAQSQNQQNQQSGQQQQGDQTQNQQGQQQNQQGQNTNQTGQQQNQTGQQTGQTGQTTATTGQNGQQQSQQQQQQNFCQQNPRAAACAELGEADYEDLEIPENVIDLNFEPADIFQTDGVCPQSKIVDLGVFGTVEFSYQQICDFASLLRPVLIAATIMMCAWFVFESVRDL